MLDVNLFKDPSATTAEFQAGDGKQKPFDFRLGQGETARFLVRVTVNDCLCRWSLDVEGSRQGRTFNFTVDDDGKPFQTTSSQNAVEVYATDGAWQTAPPPVVLADPPAGMPLPEFTACDLLTANELRQVLQVPVQQTIAEANGVWSAATKVSGLAPQAINRCYFDLGRTRAQDQDGLIVEVVRARTAQDANAIAADNRRRDASTRWRSPAKGTFANESGSILLVRGTDIVALDFVTPNFDEQALVDAALPRARKALDSVP